MSTKIRPEVSKKNRNWIDRHRYYELKHFCLQYPIWKKALLSLNGINSNSGDINSYIRTTSNISDPTAKTVELREIYVNHIEMVEQVAIETSADLSDYILKAVTEELSYEYLKTKLNIPCCKDVYYELYRRFFWLLSRARR